MGEDWDIVDNKLFRYLGTGEEMNIPYGVKSVDLPYFRRSIADCNGTNKLTIPGTLVGVPDRFFRNKLIKELVLEEGIERIGESAFSSSYIKKLVLPSTIKYIDNGAFYNCKLTELVLNEGIKEIGDRAFGSSSDSNNINRVVFPKTLSKINLKAFYPMSQERVLDVVCCFSQIQGINYDDSIKINLFIIIEDDFDFSKAYEFVKSAKYKKQKIQKITFIGYKNDFRLFLLKQIVKEMGIGIEMLEDKDRIIRKEILGEESPKKKPESKTYLGGDLEIEKLVQKIKEKSNILEDALKQDVLTKVDELVKKYQSDLEALKPKLEKEPQINLRTYPTPKSLKLGLIAELNAIDMNFIDLDNNFYLKEKIEKYRNVVNENNSLEKQSQVETVEDKIRQIKYYASSMNQDISNEILKILSDIENSLTVPSLDTIILKMNKSSNNFEQELNNRIDDLYKKAEKSYVFYQSLKDENDTSLGNDMKQLMIIINFLDSTSKNDFQRKVDEIITKYLNEAGCLKIDSESELNFRKEIMPVIEEIAKVVPNMEEKKDVLNDLSTAKSVLKKESPEKLGAIASTVNDILLLVEVNEFGEKEKEKINLSVQEVLEKSYKQIVNNSFAIDEREDSIDKNLAWNLRATLKILKELNGVQIFIDEMIKYNEELSTLTDNPKKGL